MREIKFRVWEKSSGLMYRWELVKKWDDLDWLSGIGDNTTYTPMQFTGLLDKQGKEIYAKNYLFDGKIIHKIDNSITPYWCGFSFGDLQNAEKYCEVIGNEFEDDLEKLYEKYLPDESN